MRRWELAAGVGLGLVAGFLIWGGGVGPEDDAAAPPVPEASRVTDAPRDLRMQRLQQELDREKTLRLELEREIASSAAAPSPTPDPVPAAEPPPESEERPKGKQAGEWIADDVLLEAGFDPSEVDALNALYEQTELERLFVRDQAVREGWLRTPRYRRQMGELNARYETVREEYGEDRYDWILYAAGRDNRVRVARVMRDSPAADIGLEVGDVVLRYDEERVFDARGLQRATGQGEAGRLVILEVERAGERIRFHPARGPLGISLDPTLAEPTPPY